MDDNLKGGDSIISRRRKYNSVFLVIGVVIFLAYLIYTNPFSVLSQVGRFNTEIYTIAVTINWVGLVFLSASWYILLKVLDVKIGFLKTLQITLMSMFVVLIFPIPSGMEIIRTYMVKDEEGSSMGKAVSSVIISKVYYFISFGVLITLAAIIVTLVRGYGVPVNPGIIWFVVIYAIANTIVLSLFLTPKLLKKIYEYSPDWIKRNVFDRIFIQGENKKFTSFIEDLDDAVTYIRKKPLENLVSLILVGFQWSTGSLTAWLVADSFRIKISFWVVVLIFAFVELIQQLNLLIPGGLGIVDAGLTGAFVVVGIPLNTASAISLLTRLATYWFELVPAAIVSLSFGYSETLKEILN